MKPEETLQEPITVNVTGEVKNPGPVTVQPYTTVKEILELAEPKEDADLNVLNPDTVLNDHDVLNVPRQPEEQDQIRLSINTSGLDELVRLPGIGPSIAQRIIDYRAEHGLFQNIEELMNVPGIGPGKYDAISSQICL
jgi:competence protein ComEA